MCTVLLPPGINPIAVNKYVVSYQVNQETENQKVVPCLLVIFIFLTPEGLYCMKLVFQSAADLWILQFELIMAAPVW